MKSPHCKDVGNYCLCFVPMEARPFENLNMQRCSDNITARKQWLITILLIEGKILQNVMNKQLQTIAMVARDYLATLQLESVFEKLSSLCSPVWQAGKI